MYFFIIKFARSYGLYGVKVLSFALEGSFYNLELVN